MTSVTGSTKGKIKAKKKAKKPKRKPVYIEREKFDQALGEILKSGPVPMPKKKII